MTLGIITADQRMALPKRGVKIVIAGPSGIGKTSLVWSLPPENTLVVDMEAGTLALEGCPVDVLDVRQRATEMGIHPFLFMQHFSCLVAGPNPAVRDPNAIFSQGHFDGVQQMFGPRQQVLGKYIGGTIFADSITMLARYGFSWAKTQPEAFSEKTGKPDNRGAYGKLGQCMVGGEGILSHLQHCPDMNIVLVGILESQKDEYGRASWSLQVDGGKTERELPGIVDELITMQEMDFDGQKHRVFVCQKLNQWGYPAKDRSGRLDVLEEPHLGKLIAKMQAGTRAETTFAALPQTQPTVFASPAEPNPLPDPTWPYTTFSERIAAMAGVTLEGGILPPPAGVTIDRKPTPAWATGPAFVQPGTTEIPG